MYTVSNVFDYFYCTFFAISFFSIVQLEQTVSQLKTSVSDYRTESSKKSTEIQNLQDDLLVLQLSLNVSESKAKKLEDENNNLVERWMKKMSEEADKMNDANAFLERYDLYSLFVVLHVKFKISTAQPAQ